MKGKIKGLYAIMDTTYISPVDIGPVAEKALRGGVRLLQLRAKGLSSGPALNASRTLRRLTLDHGAAFIVNDRVDIAVISGADGVHLGQDDIPLPEARSLLGEGSIIGVSTHDPEEATSAEKDGADYISFGPIFPTKTKTDAQTPRGMEYLSVIRKTVSIPIVAIGGITCENAEAVLRAGADSVAVISDILLSDDITGRVSQIISRIKDA